MARSKATEPNLSGKLTALIQTRVSARAEELLKQRTERRGVTPAAWVRMLIYRSLRAGDP